MVGSALLWSEATLIDTRVQDHGHRARCVYHVRDVLLHGPQLCGPLDRRAACLVSPIIRSTLEGFLHHVTA